MKGVTDLEIYRQPAPLLEAGPTASEKVRWGIQQDSEWVQHPIALRPQVGHSLVQTARNQGIHCSLAEQLIHNAAIEAVTPDLWATPFHVGYLNVGYRQFQLSFGGIADLVKQQRPDILFRHGQLERPGWPS